MDTIAASDSLWRRRRKSRLGISFGSPVIVVILLTGGVVTSNAFSVPRQRSCFRRAFLSAIAQHDAFNNDSSGKDPLNRVSEQFQSLSVEAIHKQLVREGMKAAPSTTEESSLILKSSSSTWKKVPGCIATVHVSTILGDDDDVVHAIQGTADAAVSRGLLAVLARVLQGQSTDWVLELDPDAITQRLGLRSALSPGRNDGVANMLRVIQSQIKNQSAEQQQFEQDIPETQESTFRTKKKKKKRVALLLSGGVDSSVALHLLLQQPNEQYEITAFYLKIWLEDELAHLGTCPWEDDYRMCEQVCEQARVPLEAVSLQREYKERVISYTLEQAQQGHTPNPDILCNSRIKFGCFYDYAIAQRGFDYVASGHYAQVVEQGKMRLLRAPDAVKDQSYFLCALTQEQLSRIRFPIGHLEKHQVRALADEWQLPNRHRPDSQGLCFLGKVKFDQFLASYLGTRPGAIVDAKTGQVLGRHNGVWYHTVGQRKGLGKVLDPLATSRGPWYVVAKDPAKDIVYCSNEYDQQVFAAARSEFCVESISWIAQGGEPPLELLSQQSNRLSMKIRHGPRIVQGTLALTSPTSGQIRLDERDGGLAPGQFVAFYHETECLGGGVISEDHWVTFLSQQATPVQTKTNKLVSPPS